MWLIGQFTRSALQHRQSPKRTAKDLLKVVLSADENLDDILDCRLDSIQWIAKTQGRDW